MKKIVIIAFSALFFSQVLQAGEAAKRMAVILKCSTNAVQQGTYEPLKKLPASRIRDLNKLLPLMEYLDKNLSHGNFQTSSWQNKFGSIIEDIDTHPEKYLFQKNKEGNTLTIGIKYTWSGYPKGDPSPEEAIEYIYRSSLPESLQDEIIKKLIASKKRYSRFEVTAKVNEYISDPYVGEHKRIFFEKLKAIGLNNLIFEDFYGNKTDLSTPAPAKSATESSSTWWWWPFSH